MKRECAAIRSEAGKTAKWLGGRPSAVAPHMHASWMDGSGEGARMRAPRVPPPTIADGGGGGGARPWRDTINQGTHHSGTQSPVGQFVVHDEHALAREGAPLGRWHRVGQGQWGLRCRWAGATHRPCRGPATGHAPAPADTPPLLTTPSAPADTPPLALGVDLLLTTTTSSSNRLCTGTSASATPSAMSLRVLAGGWQIIVGPDIRRHALHRDHV